jgi:hypothetical protein
VTPATLLIQRWLDALGVFSSLATPDRVRHHLRIIIDDCSGSQ